MLLMSDGSKKSSLMTWKVHYLLIYVSINLFLVFIVKIILNIWT